MSVRAHRAGVVACAVLLLVLAAGCQRRTSLVTREGDSTVTMTDTSLIEIRNVQQEWEGGGDFEAAAAKTAAILHRDLSSRPHAEWRDRAQNFLDSLGIGAETAGGSCAVAVNLFARSDPSAGSWPYLYWCGPKEARFQAIEGKGLKLLELTMRADPSRGTGERLPVRAAALFARTRGGREEPMLMVWDLKKKSGLDLLQTLGPDSLGGAGTGEFQPADTTVELVTRTYRNPPGFDECASCPHVYRIHHFRWQGLRFERVQTEVTPSPYSSFVQFIQMLQLDPSAAELFVTDRNLVDDARRFEWDRRRGTWRVAPATDESPGSMTFFRGTQEAYRVSFQRRGDEWLISGFEVVPRSVE